MDLTARFSVPRFEDKQSFDMSSFTCQAKVCRVDHINNYLRKIAVQFAQPLPFKPGEQADNEADEQMRMKAVTI
jgi:hypothetical protein